MKQATSQVSGRGRACYNFVVSTRPSTQTQASGRRWGGSLLATTTPPKKPTWSGVRSGEGGELVCDAEERARAAVAATGLALAMLRVAAVAVRRRRDMT